MGEYLSQGQRPQRRALSVIHSLVCVTLTSKSMQKSNGFGDFAYFWFLGAASIVIWILIYYLTWQPDVYFAR